jgi:hypothetical protein
MTSYQRLKYYQSLMGQFHASLAANQFLDTTIRLGNSRTVRCSRLALGKYYLATSNQFSNESVTNQFVSMRQIVYDTGSGTLLYLSVLK